jgi:SAM-dependent methyltransferase
VTDPRARGRELASESIARGDVTGWFERLYAESAREGTPISWLDLAPNPYLVEWAAAAPAGWAGRGETRARALVVGCGYGDDAEFLAGAGLAVVAFDVAPTAVAKCRERFPSSNVRYVVADILSAPTEWRRAFDFVFEAYTVQVLHGEARTVAARAIGETVADRGRLLVVARSRKPADPEGAMPWPLTREELDAFGEDGLERTSLREVLEPGDPPVPRFVADYIRR